jgi:hypothetical protein
MIKKLRSFNSKSVILFVLAVSIIPGIFTIQQQQQIVQASNDNDDNNNCAEKSLLAEIVCGGQEALTGYNQGVSDGKSAAANGQSNQCPQSDDLSGYCLGFRSGWNRVSDAQKTLDDVNNNNNNNNNHDDDNGNGNREDDGEFVPRVIQQQDVPKRVIGQD